MNRRHFIANTVYLTTNIPLYLQTQFYDDTRIAIIPPISCNDANCIISIFNRHKIIFRVHYMFVFDDEYFVVLIDTSYDDISRARRYQSDVERILLTSRAMRLNLKMLRDSIRSKTAGASPVRYNTKEYKGIDQASSSVDRVSMSAGKLPGIWLESRNILALASRLSLNNINRLGTINALSTALGVEAYFISNLIAKSVSMYSREFRNNRWLWRPITILKEIQKIIAITLFSELEISSYEYSYRRKRAIKNIAMIHRGKKFVLKLDIFKFFPSIKKSCIVETLIDNGFYACEAEMISNIVTRCGSLPEGSPSSPVLASAVLKRMDERFGDKCISLGLRYTRYVDDITISGNEARRVLTVKSEIEKYLRSNHSLRVNHNKTKIMPRSMAQNVLGCVVNEKVQPSRRWRQEVRSQLHNWAMGGKDIEEEARIRGKLAFWSEFDQRTVGKLIQKYGI